MHAQANSIVHDYDNSQWSRLPVKRSLSSEVGIGNGDLGITFRERMGVKAVALTPCGRRLESIRQRKGIGMSTQLSDKRELIPSTTQRDLDHGEK